MMQEFDNFPVDWEQTHLATLLRDGPTNGYSPKAGEIPGGTLTLRLSATTPGRLVLVDETTKRLSEIIHPTSALFLEPGDVLVQRSNTIDLVGTTVVFDGPPNLYVYPDLLIRMRFHRNETAHWFWRYANSLAGRQYFRSVAAGSTGSMPKLSGERLRRMPVPLPSLPEQRAIAAALSDVDELIGALDAAVAKKRAIKLATMQQLLTGKTRLPGFSGEWRAVLLGEFASIRNEKIMRRQVNPSTPCVELEHIAHRDGRLLGLSTAGVSTSSKYQFRRGDVLFGRLRSYLRKYWHADRDGICSTEIWPLRVDNDQACTGFLRAIVETDTFINAASVSYGTHMPRADWGVIRNFEVSLPPRPEQEAIAAVLSDMDAEISALEQCRDKAKAIKQGMMQQLLTGRVRLVEPTTGRASAC